MKEALVIINAQNGMIDTLEENEQERFLSKMQSALEAARRKKVTVIFVKDNRLVEKSTEAWNIHETLAPSESDLIVQKEGTDAFLESMLDDMLRISGVQTMVVGGLKTEFSIDSTCRKATSFGYQVKLLKDAHSTTDTKILTTDQIIQHHNMTLSRTNNLGYRVQVISTDEWIRSLEK